MMPMAPTHTTHAPHRRRTWLWPAIRRSVTLLAACTALLAACSDGPTALAAGDRVELTLHGLRALDPATEGTYEAWVYASDGGTPVSAGRFTLPANAAGTAAVDLTLPISSPVRVAVSVEAPGDTDPSPSPAMLLTGEIQGGSAHLTILGVVTDGRPLETAPGHHSLFTSSNNVELGYPSAENAGLWMFSIQVNVNKHGTREVKLTPLRRGWTYEGWIVWKQGTPGEVWIPYGKFRPDQNGLLTSRDNDGSGPFSGDDDYVNGGVEDVPGSEFTTRRVADALGVELPGNFALPLALDSVDASGEALWHHVITIEPAGDEGEPLMSDRPFLLQPYRNAIGAGGPGLPREIVYQANDPSGDLRPAR